MIISLPVKEAKSWKDKIIGLIGKNKSQSLLLYTRFGIHTLGMKYSIDVLILDKHNKVKYLKYGLEPNKIYLWNPSYSTVVELPSGTIEQKKIKIGDEIKFLLNDRSYVRSI